MPTSPSFFKTILHSKRANIFYLEKCRVMVKDGRVLYLCEDAKDYSYWNIPYANTTCILLGIGTSITQAAVRMCAESGVLIGFCGNGGTPLFMASEVEWLTPQSEYRPTEYMQGWMSFWFDETKRLTIAKIFQLARISCLRMHWDKNKNYKNNGFNINDIAVALERNESQIKSSSKVTTLLQSEAELTKLLYKYSANLTQFEDFTRNREGTDQANNFLNHGNYLAYGLAATVLWVLGIPHGFAVMHGKTRRGALVFDVADLIKDAVILPLAFICAKENATAREFRHQCIQSFTDYKVIDFMFNNVKQAALYKDWDTESL